MYISQLLLNLPALGYYKSNYGNLYINLQHFFELYKVLRLKYLFLIFLKSV